MKEKKLLYIMLGIVGILLIVAIIVVTMLLRQLAPASAAKTAAPVTVIPIVTAAPTSANPEATPTLTPVSTPQPSPTPVPTATPTPTPVPVTTDFPKEGLKVVPEGDELIPGVREITICTNGSLNVRSGPGTDYKALTTVKTGDVFRAYGVKNNWFLVEYKSGKTGWVSGRYAYGSWMFDESRNEALEGLTKPQEDCDPEVAYILADGGANVRTEPKPAATLVETWADRLEVIKLGSTGSWDFCNYKGTFGWVAHSNFSDTPLSSVSDGTHLFSFGEKAAITEAGDVFTVSVNITKPLILTEGDVNKVTSGQTIEKHGITVDASMYASGDIDFVWNKSKKGYTVNFNGMQANYKSGTATLVLNDQTKITDYMYPLYGTFTASEMKKYGISDSSASFKGGELLSAYRALMKKQGQWAGMFGSVTVEDGIVTSLLSEYAP